MRTKPRPDRCLLCEARLSNSMCQLPQDAFERFFGESRATTCEPGAVLFRQGDLAPDIVIIRKGQVKLVFEHPDGSEQILRVAGPGETLGLCRASGAGMPVTAIARKAVSICRTRVDDIEGLIRTSPDFALAWTHLLADEVERTREALLFHGAQPASVRLAGFLVRSMVQQPSESVNKTPASVAMTHGELAATLSLVPETVTRLLRTLEEQKVVGLGRGRIDILDPDRLNAIAGYDELVPGRGTGNRP